MNNFRLIIPMLLLLAFASCKKDNDTNPNSNNGNNNNGSTTTLSIDCEEALPQVVTLCGKNLGINYDEEIQHGDFCYYYYLPTSPDQGNSIHLSGFYANTDNEQLAKTYIASFFTENSEIQSEADIVEINLANTDEAYILRDHYDEGIGLTFRKNNIIFYGGYADTDPDQNGCNSEDTLIGFVENLIDNLNL